MQAISKNIIFYITIVENDRSDHSFLRKVIHSVLPQAIVESVYSDEEAIRYFNNCTTLPHLIFLDSEMLKISGRDTLHLIRRVDGLAEVPIVFLTKLNNGADGDQEECFNKQNSGHYYSKPYGAKDLLNIVGSVNNKWLA